MTSTGADDMVEVVTRAVREAQARFAGDPDDYDRTIAVAAIAALRDRMPGLVWRPIDDAARSGDPMLLLFEGGGHSCVMAWRDGRWTSVDSHEYSARAFDAYIPIDPATGLPVGGSGEPVETQDTITAWCDERFPALADPTAELHRRASRILEETVEFAVAAGVTRTRVLEIASIAWDKSAPEFGMADRIEGELADVLITVLVTMGRRGIDSGAALDRRMARNRNRPAAYYAGREAEKLALGLDAPLPIAQAEAQQVGPLEAAYDAMRPALAEIVRQDMAVGVDANGALRMVSEARTGPAADPMPASQDICAVADLKAEVLARGFEIATLDAERDALKAEVESLRENLSIADGHIADISENSNAVAAERDAALAREAEVVKDREALRQDATRWRALIGCPRLRILGSAGFAYSTKPANAAGYRHFGAEFWSHHDTPSEPISIGMLIEFADHMIALAAPTPDRATLTEDGRP